MVLASRYSIRLRKKLDQLNRLFLESLEGVRVIRAFNKQKTESGRFEAANTDYALTAMTAGRISSLLMPAISSDLWRDDGGCAGYGRLLCGHRRNGGWLFSSEQPVYQHGAYVGNDAVFGHDDVPHQLCLCKAYCRGAGDREHHPGRQLSCAGPPAAFYGGVPPCYLCLPGCR